MHTHTHSHALCPWLYHTPLTVVFFHLHKCDQYLPCNFRVSGTWLLQLALFFHAWVFLLSDLFRSSYRETVHDYFFLWIRYWLIHSCWMILLYAQPPFWISSPVYQWCDICNIFTFISLSINLLIENNVKIFCVWFILSLAWDIENVSWRFNQLITTNVLKIHGY